MMAAAPVAGIAALLCHPSAAEETEACIALWPDFSK